MTKIDKPQHPVIQSDRDFAADWIIITPGNAKLIRDGKWDHHLAVQAAAAHRLSGASKPSTSQEPGVPIYTLVRQGGPAAADAPKDGPYWPKGTTPPEGEA